MDSTSDLTNLNNIRNFVICAHVDSGKTTMSDSILGFGNLINFDNIGEKRGTDTRPDEIARGITIKSTGVTLGINYEDREYMLNLIDTPGHSDFSMNVSASLKITDGCIVLLDAVSGIETQTITVLRQALAERVRPVLVINKFDRLIHELKLEPEEAYVRMVKMISDVNNIIADYQSDENRWLETELSPNNGTVVFTSAYRNWGFDIDFFATFYANKTGQPKENWLKILWGDYFVNPETQKISTVPSQKRVFNEYIYKPMKNLYDAILEGNVEKYSNIMKRFDFAVNKDDTEVTGAELYKRVFRRLYPLAPVLKRLIVTHMPSPVVAQKYRVDVLYDGPLTEDDSIYRGIKNCDPNGPTVFFTSLMVPADKNAGSRFNAFGRMFSGTIKPGDKVTIIGENYEQGVNKSVVFGKNVPKVIKMVAAKTYTLESASAGQIIALCGIDQYLLKSGTITSHADLPTLYPIKTVKFVVSPVVRCAVSAKNPADMPKLVEGMKRLSKSDPIVECIMEETGENIIACVGSLHLEISINDLKEFAGVEIVVSEPVVPLRETITTASGTICLKKSSNKHNRLYMTAEPLPDELIADLESGEYSTRDIVKLTRLLVDKYGWSKSEVLKIWGMAPYDKPSNILVDCTTGLSYLNEIKDGIFSGFMLAVNSGIICGEQMRGIRFNVVDMVLHSDAIHRGAGQSLPMARDCVYACVLANNPTVYEPIFNVSVSTVKERVGTIYSCLSYRRGEVINEESVDGTPTVTVTGTLPVIESFDFDSYLKEQTSGQAFPNMTFSHWKRMEGKIKDDLILKTRTRKDPSKPNVPDLMQYMDKL